MNSTIEMDFNGMCLSHTLLLQLVGQVYAAPASSEVDVVLRNVAREPFPLLRADYGDMAGEVAEQVRRALREDYLSGGRRAGASLSSDVPVTATAASMKQQEREWALCQFSALMKQAVFLANRYGFTIRPVNWEK